VTVVSNVNVRNMVRDERADLARFLASLSPLQWEAPTLCERWRVRDVVAHVISYDDLSAHELLARAIQGRLRSSQINAIVMAPYAMRTPSQLLDLLTEHVSPRGLPGMLGGRVGLVETLVHHQDIRRGLGQPRTIPAERLRPALRTALIAPDVGSLRALRGVRLVATDLRFAAGAGLQVRGPAEALLMVIAGRPQAVSELSGPGRDRLAARLRRPVSPRQR
jgi:uncharacterized protein (TIGR03083 family)